MDPISQFIVNLLNNILGGLSGPIQPLINLIGFTPLELSTANPIVDAGWHLMVGAADAFLGLTVIVGAIQVMYGQSTGTLYMPIGQFLSKALLTVIGTAPLGGGQFGQLSHSLDSIVDSPYPC